MTISKGKACLPTGNFQGIVFRESMLQLSEMRTKGTPQDWDAYFLAGQNFEPKVMEAWNLESVSFLFKAW